VNRLTMETVAHHKLFIFYSAKFFCLCICFKFLRANKLLFVQNAFSFGMESGRGIYSTCRCGIGVAEKL
jgi:hypothetical protein